LSQKSLFFEALTEMPMATTAMDAEILSPISKTNLAGLGISDVGAHLLGAVVLTAASTLRTNDQRRKSATEHLDVSAKL